MKQTSKTIRNTAIRLISPKRFVSTGILPRYEQVHAESKASFLNHFNFIDTSKQAHVYQGNEPRLIAQRDGPNIVDRVSNASGDANYQQHVQPLISYIDPVKFSNEELACISNGLTNLELRLEGHDGKTLFTETDLLRRFGKHTYTLAVMNQFKIFQNIGYLSCSESDIESDVTWLLNNKTILEFMKLNGLTKCVSMNSELLINKNLDHAEFEAKKKAVFNSTTIGSFYTLVGLIHFKPTPVSQELMDKIINGKRGVFGILKQNA